MLEELWMEVHDIVQEAVIKTIPPKKKCKKAKWLSEEALQIVEKRREVSLLLLPPIPPSIRVFSNESALHMRWPKYQL